MINCFSHGTCSLIATSRIVMKFLAFSLAFLSLSWPQKAPQPPAQDEIPLIKVDVDLVSILCSVRDKKNGLISNLTKDDFTIVENGTQQQIKNFTRETDLPLTIGLLVDVSGSQEGLIGEERRTSNQFFQKVLRPKDMAFVISFGSEAELLQDYTNSLRLLREGLEGLRLNTSVSGIHPGPVPNQVQRGTIMFDAVYLAADDKLKREVGRKVIVLITDGMDQGSRVKIDKAIEAAQKSDAIIYSIFYEDPYFRARNRGYFANDSALKKLSEETGGRVFHVGGKLSLDGIFDQIQQEMRSQYTVTYTPTNPQKDGSYRKVEIKLANKDLKPQARKGYYATPNSN